MSFRYKFSIVLVVLGLISLMMSTVNKRSASVPPEVILKELQKGEFRIPADQLAGFILNGDSGIRIIDLRDPEEYKTLSIPGAINIPLFSLLEPENKPLLDDASIKTIYYDNDESLSTRAWILSLQKGYSNLSVLKGGLNKWDSIIMHSAFTGDKITPQENALFEKRYKVRRLFNQWNAMPDSLKSEFFASRQKKEKELVGGCE